MLCHVGRRAARDGRKNTDYRESAAGRGGGVPVQREFLSDTLVDLGMSPLCTSYLRPDQLNTMKAFYPLHVYVCLLRAAQARS
jgi:Putative zinc binding domain